MLKKLTILSFLMVSLSILATEKAKEIKSATPVTEVAALEMTAIKKWEDVTPFADQIVFYKATNYRLTCEDTGYPINPQDTLIRAGYVSKKAVYNIASLRYKQCGHGYQLQRLLKKSAVPHMNTYLITPFIEDNETQTVFMRKATPQERGTILQAIQSDKAEFDYMSLRGEESMDALKR